MTWSTVRASPNSVGKAIRGRGKKKKRKKESKQRQDKAKHRTDLPPTLIFHFGKFLVVLFQSFPKLLVLCFNVVQTLHFELELLPKVQSRHGIYGRGKRPSPHSGHGSATFTATRRLGAGHLRCPGSQPPAGSPVDATACQKPGYLWPPCPPAPRRALGPRAGWLGTLLCGLQRMCMQMHPPGPQPMDAAWEWPRVHCDLPTALAWCDTRRISRSSIGLTGRGCVWRWQGEETRESPPGLQDGQCVARCHKPQVSSNS